MPISIVCPSCGTTLNAPDHQAGKSGKCPKCQTRLELPPATPAPADREIEAFQVAGLPASRGPLMETATPSAPAEAAEPDVGRKRRKKKPKGFLGRLPLPSVSVNPDLVKLLLGMAAVLGLGFAGFHGVRMALRAAPPPVIAAESWQPVEVAGRFKILLPGPSHPITLAAAGMQMTQYNCQPDKDSIYAVAYTLDVLPPNRRGLPAETLLNDACDAAMANTKSQGAVEVSRRSIQLGPYEGKELISEIPRHSAKMISRAYVVHGRLYTAMAGAIGLEPDHANVKRLFESFEILDQGAAAPPADQPAPAPTTPPSGQPGSAPATPPANTGPPAVAETPSKSEPRGKVRLRAEPGRPFQTKTPGKSEPRAKVAEGGEPGNLLINGSFEDGPEPTGEGSMPLEKGSDVIKGWRVTRGSIDYVGRYWQAAHGTRSIDLDGSTRGGVEQTFATRKGRKYRVTFHMAGNPHPIEGPSLKKLGVQAANQSAEFEFDANGRSNQNMGWAIRTWEFTAAAEQTTLEFYSLSGQLCGPTLDNVSVVEIKD
jgi:choice-of-anchor C domain-containing protein